MRQRALSALVFVPLLLIVLVLGEPWFGALIAAFVAVAAWETARLLRGAGYPAVPWLVIAGALAVAADVASPSWLSGYGDLLIAAAVVAAGIAAFSEKDTKVGFAAWMATAFGAVYVGLLAALVRLGLAAPAVAASAPAAQLGGQRGWILLVILLVWAFDTGAYLVGIALGKRKFLAHISPSKSYWGLFGGLVRISGKRSSQKTYSTANGTVLTRRSAARPWARPGSAGRACGAGRGPGRVDAEALRGRQRLQRADSGPRRDT